MMDIPTIYCESFLIGRQPINVFSNVLFVALGLWAMKCILQHKMRRVLLLLPLLLIAVGAASMWWHHGSSAGADIADTLSIALFCIIASILLLGHLTKRRWLQYGIVGLLLASALWIEQLPGLNGSLVYIWLLLFMSTVLILLTRRYQLSWTKTASLISLFSFAIIVRSIDMARCDTRVWGTHFLWHLAMAVVGYMIIGVLMEIEQSSS